MYDIIGVNYNIMYMILDMITNPPPPSGPAFHHILTERDCVKPKDYQKLPLLKLDPGNVNLNQVFWLMDNAFSLA
jgi:hypothetical protein